MSTTVVTVDKTKTVSITKNEPEVTTVVACSPVTTVTPYEPEVSEVERAPGEVDVAFVGLLGPRGPQGLKGDPGDINGSTDQLAEGTENLYFTVARAAAAAPVQSINGEIGDVLIDAADVGADPVGTAISAASAAVGMHLSDPDPHPQYLNASDSIDGGNF